MFVLAGCEMESDENIDAAVFVVHLNEVKKHG